MLAQRPFHVSVLALFAFSLAVTSGAPANSNSSPARDYQFLESGSYVQDKNFYLLTLLEKLPDLRNRITQDQSLAALKSSRMQSIARADQICAAVDKEALNLLKMALVHDNIEQCVATFSWPDDEIRTVSDALARIAKDPAVRRELIEMHMRRSGLFQLYADLTDEEMLRRAWSDAAKAMNRISRVYGLGEAPYYREIDRTQLDVKSELFHLTIGDLRASIAERAAEMEFFFQPSLRFALSLLAISEREHASAFEPLTKGENAAVLHRIPSIQWTDYPYTVILVPGQGPPDDRLDLALPGHAAVLLDVVAKRFRDKQAPIILLTGGRVHPPLTAFTTSVETKKALMRRYRIPEDAILIDPFARHTTTDFRNAARLMFRYGLPFDRMALVTSMLWQTEAVGSGVFKARNEKELGYQPMFPFRRISRFDLEFKPSIVSLHADALDPLDP